MSLNTEVLAIIAKDLLVKLPFNASRRKTIDFFVDYTKFDKLRTVEVRSLFLPEVINKLTNTLNEVTAVLSEPPKAKFDTWYLASLEYGQYRRYVLVELQERNDIAAVRIYCTYDVIVEKPEVNIISPKEIHNLAKEKGWWDNPRPIPELLCLLHSEISEALESYRNGVPEGDKHCLSEELADLVISIWDMSAGLNIDIVEAVHKKHLFNKTRDFRHGGKKC